MAKQNKKTVQRPTAKKTMDNAVEALKKNEPNLFIDRLSNAVAVSEFFIIYVKPRHITHLVVQYYPKVPVILVLSVEKALEKMRVTFENTEQYYNKIRRRKLDIFDEDFEEKEGTTQQFFGPDEQYLSEYPNNFQGAHHEE